MIAFPRRLARRFRAACAKCISGRPRGPAPCVVIRQASGRVTLTATFPDVTLEVGCAAPARGRAEVLVVPLTALEAVAVNAGKVGVLVEVDCNTDFVARNDEFVAFARDVAMHVAASPETRYVAEDEIPEDARDAELRVFEQQAADKPENVRAKIAEGKLRKWMEETVLLNQAHVHGDKYDGKTIEQLRADLSSKTGENVVVRRFTRFAVGE